MLIHLLSLLAIPQTHAAQCCGWFNNLQETELWAARDKLCSNVWSNPSVDGGYLAKVTLEPRIWTTAEYAFWAKSDSGSFSECWDATEQIITQCARNGHSVGTWEAYGQTYAMSAATLEYRHEKRESGRLRPLPDFKVTGPSPKVASGHRVLAAVASDESTPDDFEDAPSGQATGMEELVDGLYEVDGLPVEVHFEGLSEHRLGTRGLDDGVLVTSKGSTTDWNVTEARTVSLGEAIANVLRGKQNQQAGTLAKRRQACEVSGYDYVMISIGEWQDAWEVSSDTMMCGKNGGCSQTQGLSKTTTESFSIGLSAGIKNDIANAALSFGYSWTRSWTRSITSQCQWKTGEHLLPLNA